MPQHKESGAAFSASAHTPNAISLVDPAGQKRYLLVTDARGRPYTSEPPYQTAGFTTYLNWVRLPAPGPAVHTLDVLFGDGGPQLVGVPLSSGAAATPSPSVSVQAAQAAPFAAAAGAGGTAGLTLPVRDLVLSAGNPAGSDAESAAQATITLRTDVRVPLRPLEPHHGRTPDPGEHRRQHPRPRRRHGHRDRLHRRDRTGLGQLPAVPRPRRCGGGGAAAAHSRNHVRPRRPRPAGPRGSQPAPRWVGQSRRMRAQPPVSSRHANARL